MNQLIENLFETSVSCENNFIKLKNFDNRTNQSQTNNTFSEKWTDFDQKGSYDDMINSQKEWFKSLYGFENEIEFKEFLADKLVILDAGCGLGYKSAWMAELAPHAIVIGMDYSESALVAAKRYNYLSNLYFVQGDIANTNLKSGAINFVLCDQVIMHTENPEETFKHLTSITTNGGTFACYVYAKKALPRELLDDYFRKATHSYSNEQLWEMSKQLTKLGEKLSNLNIIMDFPDIPLLGIKGGEQDLQRFIYWNFIKCFYRADWDKYSSDSTNFDWYAPSNAKRYSRDEFKKMISDNGLKLEYFHEEEACFSGRFIK
jgi:SAM-dependent methyltransferase